MDIAVKQLRDVQDAIQINITSIKALLDQADTLSATIGEVTDEALKAKLSANLADLYKTIDTLVGSTNSLFDELVEYASVSERYKQVSS